MEKNKILSKLEKYSPWIKINRKLAGPVFIISVVYILAYLAIIFYFWEDILKLDILLKGLCFIGFGVFLAAVYLAFIGILLRRIK